MMAESAVRPDLVVGGAIDGAAIADFAQSLAGMPVAGSAAAQIDTIRALEDLKSACVAAQARATATFAAQARAEACGEASASVRDASAVSAGAAANAQRARAGEANAASAAASADSGGGAAAAATRADSGGGAPAGSTNTRAGGGASAVDEAAIRSLPPGTVSRGRQAAEIRRKALRLAVRSAAAQVALARRESPARGGRYVGLAEILIHEMPLTLAALEVGVLNERRAEVIARETACLSRAQRGDVDREIADQLEGLDDRSLETLVRSIAYRLEPKAATERADRAAKDRRVTIRPAPDTMAYLTLLLPLATAVACYGAVTAAADAHPGGDGRSRSQRVADLAAAALVAAGTGPATGPAPELGPQFASGPTSTPAGDPASATATQPTHIPGSQLIPGPATGPGSGPGPQFASGPAPRSGTSPNPASATNPGAGPSTGPSTDCASHRSHRVDPVDAVRAAYREFKETQSGSNRQATQDSQAKSPPANLPPAPPGSTGIPSAGNHDARLPDARDHVPELPSAEDPRPTAGQHFPPGVGVVLNLVISDRTLFGDGDEPARLQGNVPMPAPLARRMVADLPRDAKVWVRRLYTHPNTGALVAMDSRRRIFPPAMRDLLFVRDQETCRMPWCSAPARHADHVRPYAAGGRTSIHNGQSLSEDCNYARTASGWAGKYNPDGSITITTPTGHVYHSSSRRVG